MKGTGITFLWAVECCVLNLTAGQNPEKVTLLPVAGPSDCFAPWTRGFFNIHH